MTISVSFGDSYAVLLLGQIDLTQGGGSQPGQLGLYWDCGFSVLILETGCLFFFLLLTSVCGFIWILLFGKLKYSTFLWFGITTLLLFLFIWTSLCEIILSWSALLYLPFWICKMHSFVSILQGYYYRLCLPHTFLVPYLGSLGS